MRWIIFAVFFFCIGEGYCQKAVIKEIKETNPISKEKYVFPLIVIPGNESSAKKMNDIIRDEVLEIGEDGFKKSLFENVWETGATRDSDFHWVLTDFAYEVLTSTNELLCLSIEYTGGKHGFTSTYYFMFANKTGERIKLENLFTATGGKILVDTITGMKREAIRKEIKDVQDSLRVHTAKHDAEKERDEEVMELFKRCLDDDPLTALEYLDFYVKNNTLYIKVEQCESGSQRALDDLGDFLYSFRLQKLRPLLSPYAKQLFSIH